MNRLPALAALALALIATHPNAQAKPDPKLAAGTGYVIQVQLPKGIEEPCPAEGAVQYLCGLKNVEDLVRIWKTQLIIGSGMTGPGRPVGGLYLIAPDWKKAYEIKPDVSGGALPPYAACPGPLDLAKFAPHGLAIRHDSMLEDTLYVVNHGGRESIEIFKVHDGAGISANLTWIGCVVLPEGASGNAVAPLPGGGFVATKFETAGDPKAFDKMAEGIKDGLLYEWTPKGGFKIIPGSEMSGANGVEVSADGKWILANAWPEQRVIRFGRNGGMPVAVKLDFLPDNIRRSADGEMLVSGQVGPIKHLLECAERTSCPHEWKAVRIDPATMKVTPVLDVPGTVAFSDATVAIKVGKTIWVGTYRGDRVAYVKAP
jgi:hypothetical protein